jgi:hypothetical protein
LRIGAGPFQAQTGQWSRLEVLSTDGQSSARMRFILQHVALCGVIDETHEFNCAIKGNRVQCFDRESAKMGGRPWCNATRQDEFLKVK